MRKKAAHRLKRYNKRNNSAGVIIFIVFMMIGIFAGVSLVTSGSRFFSEARSTGLQQNLVYPTLTVTPTIAKLRENE